ncbi:hypothetical protein [Alterinioella nitratireducens]|uniref:hypothetical protein n=1 Tax=Alterinioella nitratireducens TaxID=2735915 RepID=UPI004058F730
MRKPDKPRKTLSDSDITTSRPARRAVLGLLAAGGIVALTPGQAQAADIDNGTWTDAGSCPRGGGGGYTGVSDEDNGRITDAGGYGRGRPYC